MKRPMSHYRSMHGVGTVLAGAISVLAYACQGQLEGEAPVRPPSALPGTAMPMPSGNGLSEPPSTDLLDKLPASEPIVMRRLSRAEYNNSVRDLVGDTTRPADGFVDDPLVHGFENNAAALQVTPALGEAYFDTAEKLASAAIANLAQLAPCSGDERACAEAFATSFGLAAWRRALSADEIAMQLSLYDLGALRRGYAGGIDLMVRSLLFAPDFIFRPEVGEPVPSSPDFRPTSWEMASRLSYMVWASTPDRLLLEAAARNELIDPAQVRAQVERLARDPKIVDGISSFVGQWFGLRSLATLNKSPELFPQWGSETGALLAREAQLFAADVVASGAPVSKLFDADYTLANGTLAAFYGLGAPASDEFQKLNTSGSVRRGLLTGGAFLASHAHADQNSPSLRGKFVREQLFCQPLPPPPPTVNNAAPMPNANQTTRERFEAHRADPSCAGCHALMDPIGLAFEHYDAAGLWRDTENGKPIDASGELVGVDVAQPFDGVDGLIEAILPSTELTECFARQWFRHALGRDATQTDASALTALSSLSKESIRSMIVSFTETQAFSSVAATAR
jgi:hypothetical protein